MKIFGLSGHCVVNIYGSVRMHVNVKIIFNLNHLLMCCELSGDDGFRVCKIYEGKTLHFEIQGYILSPMHLL